VDVRLRGQGHQEGQVIDAPGDVRKNTADPAATTSVLLKGEGAFHHGAGRRGDGLDVGAGVERLAVALLQGRFVVKGVALADAAVHEQLHDALDLCPVVQSAVEVGLRPGRVGEQAGFAKQSGQGDTPKAAAEAPEQVPAGRGVHAFNLPATLLPILSAAEVVRTR
jgi:hypothetical protein